MWEDTTKPPYKLLFNAGLPAIRMWRCAEVLRSADVTIKSLSDSYKGKDRLVVVHGNRLIQHCLYRLLPTHRFDDPDLDVSGFLGSVGPVVTSLVAAMIPHLSTTYPNSYPANLFKNASACKAIAEFVVKQVGGPGSPGQPE